MNWREDEDGDFSPVKNEGAIDSLPAGVYEWIYNLHSYNYLKNREFKTDELITLEDGIVPKVLASIENFWSKEQVFKDAGFLWKRGILLWGPPGSGKTALSQIIAEFVVKNNGIVLNTNSTDSLRYGLSMIRAKEKVRPIVAIMEEVDRYDETALLPILDGSHQHSNVIYIATTNYPEKLSSRLTNRPSRFDEIIFIDMPEAPIRDEYLTRKSKRLAENEVERRKWVTKTDGMSIAHLRELLVSVECLDRTFETAINEARAMFAGRNDSSRWETKMKKTDW